MTDMTLIYATTFRVAMILAGLALTAYQFRRMSNLQIRRNPLALQTAREMRPAQVRTWRTH
jgi:hypothetical protein